MNSAALMQLWDAIDSDDAPLQSVEWHRRAHAALTSAGTIEAYMRPSPAPGLAKEDGGVPGASPLQLDFWRTFDEHVYGDSIPLELRKLIFAYVAANRAGKTVATFSKFCKHLRDHAQHGQVFWLIAASIDSMKGVPLRTVWQMLPRSMFGPWAYHPKANLPSAIQLKLPDDRGFVELWPKTENQDIQEFESEAVSGWLWTECRREAILHAMEPRMSSGGFGIMDYIPCEPWHAAFREDAKVPNSKVHYIAATVFENQHNLAEGFVRNEMPVALGGRGTMSVEEWNLRGLGKPAAFEGVVYKQFHDEHIVKAFGIPPQWPLYLWGDWGYRNPHAICLATVAPNECKYVIGEEYDSECTVFETCRRLWLLVDSWRPMRLGQFASVDEMFHALRVEMNETRVTRGKGPVRVHMESEWRRVLAGPLVMDASVFDRDQADGTALADEFDLCGMPITASVKANKDGGVELVRRHLEQYRLLFFAAAAKTIRDHRTWRYKENRDRIPDPDDRYERKNDHGPAAVMYGLRSAPSHNPPRGGAVADDAP